MKTDLLQSCGHYWVFQICWHIECSTFTASSFRIWNSSTGIPSPPLALFIVLLSKAHLTSYSRMSGSRWVITPSLLPYSWRYFLYSSSVYSCHLFLKSSASFRSIQFLFFIEPILSSRKTFISALLTIPKPLTLWITINCGKCWKRWDYQTTWPASWEICMQVRKQQLELDVEQQTGSK